MVGLSLADLTEMRTLILDLLPDTCDILSVTKVSDGQGGMTSTWTTTTAGVACRLDMQQGREQISGGALQPFTSFMLSLPYDTTITTTNRVAINDVTYAVTSVNNNQSWIAVRRVMLELV